MDTPLAVVHKENVHVGGGKATSMRKPVKPAGRKALADLTSTKKHLVNRVSNVANLNTHSLSVDNFKKGNKPLNRLLTDEEIKQCYEWSKDGIEEMGGYSWSKKNEANLLMNQTLPEIMASSIGVSVSELEQPFLSDDEGYETDGPYSHSSISFPGRHSSFYAPEELDDHVGVSGILLDEYPLPELRLNDDLS